MAARSILATIALLSWAGAAPAIDGIVLEIGEISMPDARISGARAQLDLTAVTPALTVTAQQVTPNASPKLAIGRLTIACAEIVVREPRFACQRARVTAEGGPTKSIAFNASASYDIDEAALKFAGSGLAIAGGHVRATGTLSSRGLAVHARASSMRITQIRALAKPWMSFPDGLAVDGRIAADVNISGRPPAMRVRLDARTADLDFSNEAGTVVAEKVSLAVRADARQRPRGFDLETQLDGTAGQALAGPVLLNFSTNPLKVVARGQSNGEALELDDIRVTQRDLLAANAKASLRSGGPPFIVHARADITSVQFPAAYTSFLQIALAATDFGTLEAAGSAHGSVEIENDAIARLDVQIDDLDLKDDRTQFVMADLRGDLHWVPDPEADVEISNLAWSRLLAYRLSGGTARLDFRARSTNIELTREARVPIFDGAVVVHSLAARNMGSPAAELDFDANIEPISMALLSKAFGWPELAGQLAGRIPGLTYRNSVLALNGDLTANVFDGTITGRNFRLQDPLGPWPRMFADVTARRLDLELVTSTFSIGSITGRLDADLSKLELFNWSPVAFDARLYSTPNDRSPHLISQKAVTNISSIGGSSGGVTSALQSGMLRFFEQFRYDRVGIECRLRNEVCLMSGVEPRANGYYLVKGRGLPRIDIIGNQGRVDWPLLLQQIVAGMRSEGVEVR